MNKRFLPSLSQIERASMDLPNPETVQGESMDIPLGKSSKGEHKITFHRVKFSSRTEGRTVRWVYSGKVMISPPSTDGL